MSGRGALFLFIAAIAVGCLAFAGWVIASGQAAYLDGIFLTATALLVAAAFGLYAVFLIRQALAEVRPAPLAKKAAAAAQTRTPEPAIKA